MPNIGEELAYVQSKVAGETTKQLTKGMLEILKYLLKKDSLKLKGGENNLSKFIQEGSPLREISLSKEYIPNLVKQAEKNVLPVAVIKSEDGTHKVVFRVQDQERVKNLLEETMKNKLNTKGKESIKSKIKNAKDILQQKQSKQTKNRAKEERSDR